MIDTAEACPRRWKWQFATEVGPGNARLNRVTIGFEVWNVICTSINLCSRSNFVSTTLRRRELKLRLIFWLMFVVERYRCVGDALLQWQGTSCAPTPHLVLSWYQIYAGLLYMDGYPQGVLGGRGTILQDGSWILQLCLQKVPLITWRCKAVNILVPASSAGSMT